MVEVLAFVIENMEAILIIIGLILGLATKYFSAQRNEAVDAAVAIVDLTNCVLNAIKDDVITNEEKDQIVAKVEKAKTEINELVRILLENDEPVVTKFVVKGRFRKLADLKMCEFTK